MTKFISPIILYDYHPLDISAIKALRNDLAKLYEMGYKVLTLEYDENFGKTCAKDTLKLLKHQAAEAKAKYIESTRYASLSYGNEKARAKEYIKYVKLAYKYYRFTQTMIKKAQKIGFDIKCIDPLHPDIVKIQRSKNVEDDKVFSKLAETVSSRDQKMSKHIINIVEQYKGGVITIIGTAHMGIKNLIDEGMSKQDNHRYAQPLQFLSKNEEFCSKKFYFYNVHHSSKCNIPISSTNCINASEVCVLKYNYSHMDSIADSVNKLVGTPDKDTKSKLKMCYALPWYVNVPILEAIEEKNLDKVNFLLASGININNSYAGYSPLGVASKYGYTEITRSLILEGANTNQADGQGSPLLQAFNNRHYDTAELLLENGANPNEADDYYSPLCRFIYHNESEFTKLFLDHDADLEVNCGDYTPKELATLHKNEKISEIIGAAEQDLGEDMEV